MNTEAEINELKTRLDRIESYLMQLSSPTQAPVIQQDLPKEPHFEASNLEIKKYSRDGAIVDYSWKVTVQNKENSDIRLIGKLIFLDSDSFEIDSDLTDMFVVPANKSVTKSGKSIIFDSGKNERVSDITMEFRFM